MPRQTNEARTIREPVDSRRGLQATVRATSTYDNARGGYVERPYGAGRDWQALAGALSQFDRNLDGYLNKRLEKNIEEGTAEGLVRFSENPDQNKNMQDWKAFAEANPQYTNDNPWVQKGYEQARLKSLGLDYEKGLNDAFVQSGLVNEKDTKKVETFTQEYDKTFRQQHGLEKYEDKIMLASNFTSLTSAAKQGLYSRHSQYLQSQNETLLGQQYSDLAVKSIDNMFDPAINGRTRSLTDPHQYEDNLNLIASTVMQNVKTATDHGYTNAKAAALAAEMVFTAADRAENPDILKALDRIQINGATLSTLPGVAAKVEQREQQRIEKQRADTRWWWAQQEHQEKQEEKQALNLSYAFSQTMVPATEDNIRQWEQENKVQIPRRLMGRFMREVNTVHEAREKAVNVSPLVREELAELRMRLRTGQSVSPREAMNASIQTGDDYYINAYTDMDSEDNKAIAESMKSVGSEVWRLFTKADEDSFAWGNGDETQLEASQRLGLEAKQLAQDKLEEDMEQFERENKGVKPTPVQRRTIERKVVDETYSIMKTRQAEMKADEEEATKKGKPVASSSTAAAMKAQVPSQAIEWILRLDPEVQEVLPSLKRNPEQLYEYIKQFHPEKLEEFNSLFTHGGKEWMNR